MRRIQSNTMGIFGERSTGQDIRNQNVTAVLAVANVIRTSLGPVGLDKMLVDDIGDVTITNDGATILKKLEVEHAAAKLLVELADLQDQEVGDGTTSVVLIAAELLKQANELVKSHIHPTSVISGYRLACREAIKYLQEHLQVYSSTIPREYLVNAAKTSLSSKVIGVDDNFFANVIVDSILKVRTVNSKGEEKYPIKSINILKSMGKSAKDTMIVSGYALNCTVASQEMKKKITGARIAFLDLDLTKSKMPLGVTVLIDDINQINHFRQREADLLKERIQMILKAGANVVLTTKGIDDMAMKYFVEAGAMAVRRCKKDDLRKIAKSAGGVVLSSLGNLEGEESFDPASLGYAEEVVQERIADDELILIKGCKNTATASIVLRGANTMLLDEIERSIHDALSIVKRVLESKAVVAGGGAAETALSTYLENFATSLGSREQLAIAAFADALLVIPRTLAANAALDATDLIATLRVHHFKAHEDKSHKEYSKYGLDLLNGKIRNNLEAGVLEPTFSKSKSIKFATEAAITILRIDDLFKLDPKPEPRPGEDEY